MLARKFVLVNNELVGKPKPSDFKVLDETLSELQDGEILVKAEWLSVDPYMRLGIHARLIGQQVGRVLKSKNPAYPEGIQVLANFGWRDLTKYKPGPDDRSIVFDLSTTYCYQLPDLKGLPASYALGALGMPGNTAYFGLLRLCDPKKGETVVVSTAGGAVGSIVGQIAKIKGCTVIGFAGDDSKVDWLKDLGFDHAFNYKKVGVHETLQKYAPRGVDVYFDNVGGEFTYNVMRNMAEFGRMAVCGAISTYNADTSKPLVPFDYMTVVYKEIKIEGLKVTRWKSEWFDAISQMRDWILEGKLKARETVREGFDQLPQAFIELFEGKNIGKMIVKA